MKDLIHEQVPAIALANSKNFVFIGEAGSGKTETALSLAVAMARLTDKKVHFFDMDQTKPLFRARDLAGLLKKEGVELHYQSQHLDAPTVAPGVIECLLDQNNVVLMDVGGGSHGSHMIGQFSHILNRDNTAVYYLINPYRPWSGGRADIEETMRRVLGTAGLNYPKIVANPNLGKDTSFEAVYQGYERMKFILPDHKVDFMCALDKHAEELKKVVDVPVFGIQLKTLPDWYVC